MAIQTWGSGRVHRNQANCKNRLTGLLASSMSDSTSEARLQADARKATATTAAKGPGGQPGNDSDSSAAG